MAPARDSPDEDFDFNDMTQQPDEARRNDQQEEEVPKTKRIACVLCRKRKLKCDSKRPACSTCVRLQHDCSYDEVRKKSGPKRGYVKALEARLAQVETLLKTQDDDRPAAAGRKDSDEVPYADIVVGNADYVGIPKDKDTRLLLADDFANMSTDDSFPWEMIGLGLDEPLPTQDVVDDLNREYFERVHPSLPMMHRARYYAAMNLAPHLRPPVALRYAMWALTASVCDKYQALQEHFYTRARKYLHQDEMRGHGEGMITISHAQAWILIGTYEFKMMFFPRAWMSAGRASRMCMMMGLHRVDGAGLDVKQCLPPPRDETDREERRRTFWMAFGVDRYASIGTGWPMVIDERDISTQLPTEEEIFDNNKTPPKALRLDEVLDLSKIGVGNLSPFAGCVLLAALFGRNLTHLHRPTPDDRDDDLLGEFWKRHRHMDDVLSATSLNLPPALRLPSGINNPNVIFLNMSIHTSTICLHQAAIFKADKNRMPARISGESKIRCITSAAEIATIMRTISHMDLSMMNPFTSFCLYVASRVFVQYLKSRPNDSQVRASLQFLLQAMNAFKRKNPLTESFLVQLDVDLEGAGLDDAKTFRATAAQTPKSDIDERARQCLFDGTQPNGAQTDATGPRRYGDGPRTYGNDGLGVYNNPDATRIPTITPIHSGLSPDGQNVDLTQNGDLSRMNSFDPTQIVNTLDLHQQKRSPGSYQSTSAHEMDTSPDANGTPNSSLHHHSSHTSNTAYSPQNQSQDPLHSQSQNTFFDTSFNDFDMQTFAGTQPPAAAQQHGSFGLPADWGSTGLTPGAGNGTGFTPGPDMLAMSDAEFSQIMSQGDFGQGWDANASIMVSHPDAVESLLASRTSIRR